MTQDFNATPAYQGPVWYVHSQGSDELGDGSEGLPFATIQNAIDVSYDSDTVYVHAGTYYENINLTKNIVLEGENRETTIIDGGQNGRVVSINGDNIVFQGFTVQNGLGALSNYGGGIYNYLKLKWMIVKLYYQNHYYKIVDISCVPIPWHLVFP